MLCSWILLIHDRSRAPTLTAEVLLLPGPEGMCSRSVPVRGAVSVQDTANHNVNSPTEHIIVAGMQHFWVPQVVLASSRFWVNLLTTQPRPAEGWYFPWIHPQIFTMLLDVAVRTGPFEGTEPEMNLPMILMTLSLARV